LYRFGYGLSYSRFTLSDPTVSPKYLSAGKPAQVTLTIKNEGKVPAAEVVQLYLHDLAASLTPQVEKLVGFARVDLTPGKSQTLTFPLTDQELGFFDNNGKFLVEPGSFEVFARTGTESTPRVSLTLK
jgi:beta-glucosidase